MVRTFEEYRYINFGMFDGAGSKKDPNEPFFLAKKHKYFQDQRDEARRQEREARRQRDDINYINGLEASRNQLPLINRCIDIIEKDPDSIVRTKYEESDYGSGIYGILLKNKTVIVTRIDGSDRVSYLKINKVLMSSTKEKKINKDVDVYGEENWEDDNITPYEKLSRLVKDYVEQNEIIF
jgi:hypothetical protein